MRPWVLGLSTGFHNGAACLCHGDEIVVAIQEERLSRIKRARLLHNRPSKAIEYCLSTANIRLRDLDLIVDCSIRELPDQPDQTPLAIFGETDRIPEVIQIPHHFGHAMSAFCTSGFPEAAVLVVDGSGSFGSHLHPEERSVAISYAHGSNEHVSVYYANPKELLPVEKQMADVSYIHSVGNGEMPIFRSLGHMFSSVALRVFGDYLEAGKVMALAPFGRPILPTSYFLRFDGSKLVFSDRIPQMFPTPAVWPAQQTEYEDLAASVQAALEEALQALVERMGESKLSSNLCYSGGVALNSVANHKIFGRRAFRNVHVLAAAEDSGTAIGAAYYGILKLTSTAQPRRLVKDSLGRSYSAAEVDRTLQEMPGITTIDTEDSLSLCVDLLCEGKIVGWFDGGSEFGPRALGHRSILCDPRKQDAKDILNSRVKHREYFRPFAPAILAECVSEWFAIEQPTPLMDFMLDVCPFRSDVAARRVPAVVHVDGTGRLQTVHKTNSPRFYELIQSFYAKTGVPMILNTSMNIMGEPIVETPLEAVWLLLSTGLDYCIIGDRIVTKAPSFRSVLDFVPDRTELANDLVTGTEGVRGYPSSHTPRSNLIPEYVAMLERLDGRSSYRHLFADDICSLRDEAQHVRILSRLFRLSLVRFGLGS